MSKICIITGKKTIFGNNRSHAMNAKKRKFLPNIHKNKFWIPSKKKFIKLNISSKGIKMINKYGIEKFLNKNIIKN